jgi:tricorn protease
MKRLLDLRSIALLAIVVASAPAGTLRAEAGDASPGNSGYYRFPAIYGDTIVFTAEGDLWRVGITGGVAQRLTSHPAQETHAVFSPDGKTLAFSAEYEGPVEVYTMSIDGGRPVRRTFEGGAAVVRGWTPDGSKVLYATRRFSTLPDWQLATVDLQGGLITMLPLSQASDGVFDSSGKTFYFTRQWFQGSSTKRYQGGTVQNLWKFALDAPEAMPLSTNFAGTSKSPMWWQGRIYFLTDRDGTMNLWSMNTNGGNRVQLTTHKGWDIKDAALSQGRIVYQMGADLRLFEIASKKDSPIPITLVSDFDQEREKWVQKPLDYLTTVHVAPDGDRIVLTARGQVFVAPVGQGRFVTATGDAHVRYRQARFMPDGKSLLALSDATGELEFETIPANGVGPAEQLTHGGKVFRSDGVASPDGKRIAYQDKNQELWLYDLQRKESKRIATSKFGGFYDFCWSPDSQWLGYVSEAENSYTRISLYGITNDTTAVLTSDRVNSYSPAWSPDGKWLYFLSERHLESVVGSPWGSRQPEPFFNEPVKIYLLSLLKDGRSPFEPNDELHPARKEKKKAEQEKESKSEDAHKKTEETKSDESKSGAGAHDETNKPPVVAIDFEGLSNRVTAVPVPPGNYSDLSANAKSLYWLASGLGPSPTNRLMTLPITNEDPKPKTLVEPVKMYELSEDGKKLLLRKDDQFYVVDAGADAPLKLEKSVDLKDWNCSLEPRDERRQMFIESWRLMRDFFYDTNMHGVDWPAMRDKYLPLVERVTDRAELSDLIADMVGELSALHIFVFGGDFREGPDQIKLGSLGADLARDESQGGYRVQRVYEADPDYPERLSPLARATVNLGAGAIIQMVNGVSVLSAPQFGTLLRNQAGRQTLLSVKPSASDSARDFVVTPMALDEETQLRYDDWELSRRRRVEELGKGEIGYVHLRAMGPGDIAAWARDFYPVFNRKGLIIDVRHNGGGNIDSWILEKLLRKAWFFWQPRVGNPTWNMQYAFRGHMTVLCDEHTGSDGEAFTEGFKRLGLGKVIGTRTWGGEIWLSFDNWLVDKGIASAAEHGVYGPEGKWLIEGHGVDPDIVVDNLPHATFNGEDAQLQAAITHLQERIRLEPVPVPPAPAHPNKSVK